MYGIYIYIIPHNPAGADKSEGGIGGLWVVDWPERLLPMWLETLREQLRLHLHFLYFSFLRHGDSAEHKEFPFKHAMFSEWSGM